MSNENFFYFLCGDIGSGIMNGVLITLNQAFEVI